MLTILDLWLTMKSIMNEARQEIGIKLMPLNLTNTEGDILFHLLSKKEGLSQEMLAERLDIDKAAISRTISSLEKKGYVSRHRHSEDARAYQVVAAKAAEDVREEIESAYNLLYEKIKYGIGESEFNNLTKLMNKLAENLHSQEVK